MNRRLLCLAIAPLLAADEKRAEPRREAEIMLRLIEATSAAGASNDAAALVPQELKSLLRFNTYHLLDSGYVRGGEKETLRLALAGSLLGEVRFRVRAGTPPAIEFDVEVKGPRDGKGDRPDLLETSATAKSGETVVLGASRMRDSANALIVLLTGKLIQ